MVSKSVYGQIQYLILGIVLGGLFGFVGSFLVTTFFRFTDKIFGESTVLEEGIHFAVACFAFFGLLIVFYFIVRDLDKKSKLQNIEKREGKMTNAEEPTTRGDPKDEYMHACNSMEEYGKTRFAQLTLFIAITAALLTILFTATVNLSYFPKMSLKVGGIVITLVFLIMEERSTKYWKHYKDRADWLEEHRLGYELHRTSPRQGLVTSTMVVRLLYIFILCLWIVTIMWHPLF